MLVHNLMTEALVTIDPEASVLDAARLMRDADVGALPVMREGADVEGVITDRDLVVRAMADEAALRDMRVQDIMTTSLAYCYDDDDATEAAKAMQLRGVRRILVFERETDQLKGIISITDFAVRGEDPGVSAIVLHDIMERRAA